MIGLPGESSSNTSPAPRAFSLILCRAPFIVPHFPIKIIRKRAKISGSVYRFSFTLPKKGYIYVIIYNSKGEEKKKERPEGGVETDVSSNTNWSSSSPISVEGTPRCSNCPTHRDPGIQRVGRLRPSRYLSRFGWVRFERIPNLFHLKKCRET